jgi:hypothetical protein
MPTWLAVLRSIVGALPALVVAVFAGLLALLGLLGRDAGRRTYALDYATRLVELATVLVGRETAGRPDGPRTW